MKLQHGETGRIIDVPDEHGRMLLRQKKYIEIKEENTEVSSDTKVDKPKRKRRNGSNKSRRVQ